MALELGSTRYKVYGEKSHSTVVLVHSFNGFLESWKPNIDSLVKNGFQVVAYDLWGRGLSDRPRTDLSLPVFRDQLNAIIDELGVDKVHLVGSSFGSVIVSDYAINTPSRVDKLVLIGPAGWPAEGNISSTLLNIPILGDLVFQYFGEMILQPKVEAYFYNQKGHEWVIDFWKKYAKYPGFTRSALSTVRHSPVLDYTDGWSTLGRLKKPTLFIWGKQDVSFPYTNSEKARLLIPHAEIVGIENAAHWVNIEQSTLVNEAMGSFLTL